MRILPSMLMKLMPTGGHCRRLKDCTLRRNRV